jgi:hypothetical protein
MEELISKWRDLSDYNYCQETMADGMDHEIFKMCIAAHRAKADTYKECADQLEVALKLAEGQKPPTNNASHVIVLQKEALKYLNKLPKSINAAKVELLIKDSIARLQAIA